MNYVFHPHDTRTDSAKTTTVLDGNLLAAASFTHGRIEAIIVFSLQPVNICHARLISCYRLQCYVSCQFYCDFLLRTDVIE